jgi:hypothetical protein
VKWLPEELHGDLWPYVLTLLPPDLEGEARAAGALRRARGVSGAPELLRLFLAYGVTRLSLKGVVAWAAATGVSSISAPALFYRLRDSTAWLSRLLAEVLSATLEPVHGPSGYRLRVIDATSISGPGATGTDWRVHALADPMTGNLVAIEITDRFAGESLAQVPLQPGDLVVGDRGYAHARGIAAAVRAGADVVVRINPDTLRLYDASGHRATEAELEPQVPTLGAAEFDLRLPEPPASWNSHKTWPLRKAASWRPVRLIAIRPRAGTLIWVLTTAPQERLDKVTVMETYRLRWQIELLFKRLKSLLDFAELPARTEPLARAWLLARLLAAALTERLVNLEPAFSPWGYRLGTS